MSAVSVDDEDGITSINITPLVDVFLVLLILVMITSTLLEQKSIPVSVPQAAHAGEKAPAATGLTMDFERRIYLDGAEADSSLIAHTLREKVGADSTHQVLIAADKRLLYEDVVRLLDWVRGSGVRKYALKVVENG
jgi:biopolymer transport protein ExbD